jgi:hypothetical protein
MTTDQEQKPQQQTVIPAHLVKWSQEPRYLAFWAIGVVPLIAGIIMRSSTSADNRQCSALVGQYVPDQVYSHCNTVMAVNAWGLKAIIFGVALIVVALIIGGIRLAENASSRP